MTLDLEKCKENFLKKDCDYKPKKNHEHRMFNGVENINFCKTLVALSHLAVIEILNVLCLLSCYLTH